MYSLLRTYRIPAVIAVRCLTWPVGLATLWRPPGLGPSGHTHCIDKHPCALVMGLALTDRQRLHHPNVTSSLLDVRRRWPLPARVDAPRLSPLSLPSCAVTHSRSDLLRQPALNRGPRGSLPLLTPLDQGWLSLARTMRARVLLPPRGRDSGTPPFSSSSGRPSSSQGVPSSLLSRDHGVVANMRELTVPPLRSPTMS